MVMERGASRFVFISRSCTEKPEAAHVVDGIKAQGGVAKVFRADAANETVVRDVLVPQLKRPLRGAVHAVMALKNGMFEQMDHASFTAAITKARVSKINAIEISLERKGLYGINEGEMLRNFQGAMSQKVPNAVSRATV
ncbi:hypothetical protein F4820DRAFT_448413 [Hypoxylon rubiginosum]|uniref:Uncharacterized protein n=1 Tax=Hypoxylon rubiginosum TaxID=110542 RepID=A0ACB9Z0T5_9PEZI|nr:hypothetical protein F4820DRAFT_448413 [Hypoxylon rubiginosum]